MREDTHTTTPEDAATYERIRGESYDDDGRPDAAEIERDMAGLPTGDEHECEGRCLVCGFERVLRKMRREAADRAACLVFDAGAAVVAAKERLSS